MEQAIKEGLMKTFDLHRVVFWYDEGGQWRELFESLELPCVEKRIIENNEFSLMYEAARLRRESKFLLYSPQAQPAEKDNWLLGLQLAQGTFEAHREALIARELDLSDDLAPLVARYAEYFKSSKRVEALRRRMADGMTAVSFQKAMIAALLDRQVGASMDSIMLSLLSRLAQGLEFPRLWGLEDFLWGQAEAIYGYSAAEPSIEDFCRKLLLNYYQVCLGERGKLTQDARILLDNWKNDATRRDDLRALADRCEGKLGVAADAEKRDYEALARLDLFGAVDRSLIRRLADLILNRQIRALDVEALVKSRSGGLWWWNDESQSGYRQDYRALLAASQFFEALRTDLSMDSADQGLLHYKERWYALDLHYRRFCGAHRSAAAGPGLDALAERVEGVYKNEFLTPLALSWQSATESLPRWDFGERSQKRFFELRVRPLLAQGKKLCVILSDALRYEAGCELAQSLTSVNRCDVEIDVMAAQAPTVTSLCMASLLPHVKLGISGDGSFLLDGAPCEGVDAREKALSLSGFCGRALRAEEFVDLTAQAQRDLVRDCDVLYIYHNEIDFTGDDALGELRLPDAVDSAVKSLVKLTKKVFSANGNTVLITSDHGFLYQESMPDESVNLSPQLPPVVKQKRRWAASVEREEVDGLRALSCDELGLEGSLTLYFPRGLGRMRPWGAGSRFVHGGLSLQETAVPLLTVRKKRQDDVSLVDVTVLNDKNGILSSSEKTVVLYQNRPVGEKVLPRELSLGIYTSQGELLSNEVFMTFDSASEAVLERERQVKLLLTKKADNYNNQQVFLRLRSEDSLEDYQRIPLLLKRFFEKDFDF